MLILLLIRPILLREILSFISSLPTNSSLSFSDSIIGFLWCFSMALSTMLIAITLHYFYWKGVKYALTTRAAIIGMETLFFITSNIIVVFVCIFCT